MRRFAFMPKINENILLPVFEGFEKRIREKLKGQHFMHHIGFKITEINAGKIIGTMPIAPFTAQQMGFVHGGVTATVADIVMGFAAYSLVDEYKHVVTADLRISYFAPGIGKTLIAKGYVEKPGKMLHFCSAEIFVENAEGEIQLIAQASATMAVIEAKK